MVNTGLLLWAAYSLGLKQERHLGLKQEGNLDLTDRR